MCRFAEEHVVVDKLERPRLQDIHYRRKKNENDPSGEPGFLSGDVWAEGAQNAADARRNFIGLEFQGAASLRRSCLTSTAERRILAVFVAPSISNVILAGFFASIPRILLAS